MRMSDFVLGVLFVVAAIYVILCTASPITQEQFARPCLAHDGVQQLVAHPFGIIAGTATVVCKDGTVFKVR